MPAEVHDALARRREIVEKALAAGRPALDEAAAKQVLAAYGVPVPAGGLVHSAPEAADLAASLGAPVAMKAVGALIQHKTETQLVILDLRTARRGRRGVRRACRARRRRPRGGARRGDGRRQPRVHGRHEARRRLRPRRGLRPRRHDDRGVPRHRPRRHPRRRGRCRGTPRSASAARRCSARSAASRPSTARSWSPSWRPSRGSPPTIPQIAEIDVNPLLIRGGEPVAADALMVLSAAAPAAAAAARVRARPRRGAGAEVRRHRRRLRQRHPLGRLGAAEHPRRRLRGRHLPGEPQGRRVLRPSRVDEPRGGACAAGPRAARRRRAPAARR